MANSFSYKDKIINVGDTVSIHYRIKEGDKTRIQIFKGILLKIRGSTPKTKSITVRKISKSGIGVEKILPVSSPFIDDIKLIKKTKHKKARAYFIRNKTESEIRQRLYGQKK